MTNDDITKQAALYLLKKGAASYLEIAQLSGRSRQIVRHWAKDYPNARAEYLAKQWETARKRASHRPR